MKTENYLLQDTALDDIESIMYKKEKDGWRLVQMHANTIENGWELFYSVAKGYEFENYKVTLAEGDTVHSISAVFPNAMLFENEIKELFGIDIKFISIDYENRFYRIAKETPFKTE